jgi:hypothetical protein
MIIAKHEKDELIAVEELIKASNEADIYYHTEKK